MPAADAEWEAALRHSRSDPQGAQGKCLQCLDLLESLLDTSSMHEAVALRLVSKRWLEAVQLLPVWSNCCWEEVSKGARRSDAALPALLLSIQRWWGSRLQEFVCGGGCPVSRYLLTDAVLAAIVRHSPHLHTVRLFGCMHITDAGLKQLAAAAPPLQTFSLEWCGRGVFLDGIRAVIRACPRLQVFSISCGQQAGGLASVDDALVLELAACCPRVTALELSDTRVGDRGLAAIAAAYGPQLQSLQVNYSRRWGPRGVAALAGRCRELQSFSAASSGGLDDDGLAALGAGCPKLTFVGVDRCAQVTLDGIMRLANRCAALQVVGMAGVHGRAGAEQQAAFARWVEARGWRFDHRAGLLAAQ